MQYHYRARDRRGIMSRGTIEAESPAAALRSLTDQGRFPLVLQLRPPPRAGSLNLTPGRVDPRQRLLFTRQLGAMLRAGLPLLPSVETLSRQSGSAPWRARLEAVNRELESGSELWRALSRYPREFPAVYIGMVRAGEHSGRLDAALTQVGDWLEREQRLRQKLRGALIYPVILASFTVFMVMAILLLVLPLFADLFTAMGGELPAPTLALMAAGAFVQRHALLLALLLALVILGVHLSRRTPGGRYRSDRLSLKLPLLGPVRAQLCAARLASTLGRLLMAGLPLLTALEISEAAADNAVVARAVAQAREQVSGGSSLAAPLAASGVFSPLFTAMIAAGEASGELGPLLLVSAADLEQESTAAVDALLALLEPLLLIIAAIVVGAIIIAVLLPVFDLPGLMT